MCYNLQTLCSNARIVCQRLDAIFPQPKNILILSGRVFKLFLFRICAIAYLPQIIDVGRHWANNKRAMALKTFGDEGNKI